MSARFAHPCRIPFSGCVLSPDMFLTRSSVSEVQQENAIVGVGGGRALLHRRRNVVYHGAFSFLLLPRQGLKYVAGGLVGAE